MPRPRKCRWVEFEPGVTFFKPQGIPVRALEQVVLSVDELEAMRLADLLGLSQEEVAREMKVSRPTVTRMLARAHRIVADALVNGKAIKIAGGDYLVAKREFVCQDCHHVWQNANLPRRELRCPRCQSEAVRRHPAAAEATDPGAGGPGS